MLRYYIYLCIAAISIVVTIFLHENADLVFILSIVFFVSTILLTFRLVNLAEEAEVTPQERPIYYYETKASYNFENYIRAAILVVAAILFMNTGNNWWFVLAIIWAISCLTILIPWYLGYQNRNWGIVAEALYQEFKQQLARNDIRLINKHLKSIAPKEITIADVLSNKLDSLQKEKYVNLYIKLMREVTP